MSEMIKRLDDGVKGSEYGWDHRLDQGEQRVRSNWFTRTFLFGVGDAFGVFRYSCEQDGTCPHVLLICLGVGRNVLGKVHPHNVPVLHRHGGSSSSSLKWPLWKA
jgi:hypothetical protein